jgi:hypothetical protein
VIVATVQRWRDGRPRYRPAGETIRTSAYEVAEIATDTEARGFVERHHYEHSYPAARLRVGLHRGDELVGVTVFSQPPSQAALEAAFPFRCEGVELGRFVLLDDVPANGESWFLARAFELARARFEAVVSHSDPCARRSAAGELVFPGHIGTIYQATNANYRGLTPRRTRRLLPDGSVLSARLLSKLRGRERGWRYGVELLVSHGAPPPAGDWSSWLRRAVELVSHPVRHPGNHRYVWGLERTVARLLPKSEPYPKLLEAAP